VIGYRVDIRVDPLWNLMFDRQCQWL